MPLTILSGSAQAAAVAGAADRIRHGGILVFPTETVYGIGADIRCASAIEKAARLKNSPAGKPLLVHCCAVDQVQGLVAEIPAVAQVLMDRFWPGPLAMIFKSLPDVPAIVTAGTGKVGIRMVSHPGFSDFCARLGAPIAGTSANMHGEPATSVFAEIDPDLLAGVDAAIDAGICGSGHPSTVIDLTDDPPRLLRAGAVASERLQAALGLRLRT